MSASAPTRSLPFALIAGTRSCRRVAGISVNEPLVRTETAGDGSQRIVVEVPGVDDPDQVRRLVGSTGHSTGPHLHLQFQPATSYPQAEPWFEAFAGRAFSWQDAPTPDARPVFEVVDDGSDPPSDDPSVITFTVEGP